MRCVFTGRAVLSENPLSGAYEYQQQRVLGLMQQDMGLSSRANDVLRESDLGALAKDAIDTIISGDVRAVGANLPIVSPDLDISASAAYYTLNYRTLPDVLKEMAALAKAKGKNVVYGLTPDLQFYFLESGNSLTVLEQVEYPPVSIPSAVTGTRWLLATGNLQPIRNQDFYTAESDDLLTHLSEEYYEPIRRIELREPPESIETLTPLYLGAVRDINFIAGTLEESFVGDVQDSPPQDSRALDDNPRSAIAVKPQFVGVRVVHARPQLSSKKR